MVNLSIREAVKHYNVSRPTLTKALKSGKLSGKQDGKNKWSIDPSELARVYQPRPPTSEPETTAKHGQHSAIAVPPDTSNQAEMEALKAQLLNVEMRAVKAETRAVAAELLAKERAERIEDLRRMLPAPEQPKKRRWWHR